MEMNALLHQYRRLAAGFSDELRLSDRATSSSSQLLIATEEILRRKKASDAKLMHTEESHGYNFRKMTQSEFNGIESWYRAQLSERFEEFEGWRIAIDNCEAYGTLGFVVLWGVSDSWANVSVFAVEESGSEVQGEDIRLFLTPSGGYDRHTDDITKAATYIDGYVKWDGCSELDQGCPHWCGPKQYKAHISLLEFIYRRAMDLMGRGEGELPWGGSAR